MLSIRKAAAKVALLAIPALVTSGCAASGTAGSSFAPAVAGAPTAPAVPAARSATLALGVRPNATTAQWPQFGYDQQHSGYNPLEKTLDAGNVSKLQVGWNDQSIVQPSGISYDKNVLYVDDMGQSNAGMYALNASTGAQKWYTNVNLNGPWGSFTHSVSAVVGNIVVTPCSNASTTQFLTGLCGLNATNGKLVWQTLCTLYQGSGCGGLVDSGTSPSSDGKKIYAQITQGVNEQPDTSAFDPKTGKILWAVAGVYHCPDGGGPATPLPVSGGLVFATLACQGSNGATEVCAINTGSGAPVWCVDMPAIYVSQVAADSKNLYVVVPVSSGNTVIALNQKSGSQVWRVNVPGSNGVSLAVDTNRLYVVNGGNGIYALKVTTGKQVWTYTANGNLFAGSQATVANGILYTNGSGGNNGNAVFAAFNDANGKLIYSNTSMSNGSAPASGIVVNGTVYTGCYTVCAFTLPAH